MRPHNRLLIAACLLALLPAAAFCQPARPVLSPEQQAAVDAAVAAEMKKQALVGVAVGVLQDNKIVYLKGYGQADRERNLPVTTRTVFNWASNSKPILALLIMLLFGDGLLDPDDDIHKHVPDYPKTKEVVKIRHLLCHMSGIPHYGKGVVPQKKKTHPDPLVFLDPVVALDRFSLSPLQFTPGDKVQYSSHAYILLSAVAQRAGKQSFYDQVQARITRPLGMSSFQMDLPFKDQPDWATGYNKDKEGKIEKAPVVDHFWKHGGGAYKSNIADFAKWAEALLTRKLHTRKLEDVMWQPQATNNGSKTTWGLGFVVEKQNGRLKISHGGKQEETTTRLVIYPEDGHGVVVMCNCDYGNPGAISTAVYGALRGK
jgi:CubicO group peptidase (beta-lactamase class C family)